MKRLVYTPMGVCSERINFTIDAGRIVHVEFLGGCDGNLQGIASLVEGLEVGEAIRKLKGIDCMGKGTSCPDQLARALEKAQD
ncbi:TPA: TIGR03905 family TSCPD domain-containing protein [Candidatus Bathyarchaeota archaeon]|nr:TIGR03905 family TSCPD domain-containing protein [Candidatus Bathyarchaeota archaeon]